MYKKGELIRYFNELAMIEADMKLVNSGYDTDYVYEHKGIKGFWIEILDNSEVVLFDQEVQEDE